MRSYLHYRNTDLGNEERAATLAVPPRLSSRSRDLAAGWRRNAADDEAVIRSALLLFNRGGFRYSLTPPRLGADPVDEFLFDTRIGFCEHYATSFVLLMRVAGIPARVVTGYQGGEWNEFGDYLIVRQGDAHAWSEVWLDGQGWVRIDPTAAVNPDRVHSSFDFGSSGLARLSVSLPQIAVDLPWLRALARQARLAADSLQTAWSRWVLGYDQAAQAMLLAKTGLNALAQRELLLLMGGLVLGLTAVVALLLYRQGRAPRDPLQQAYADFCRRLARRGIERRPWEGPQDFAARAAAALPAQAERIRRIAALYIRIRYGGDQRAILGRALLRAVRGLRL
jgi:hypothetical protein